jgi:hypothetical protein
MKSEQRFFKATQLRIATRHLKAARTLIEDVGELPDDQATELHATIVRSITTLETRLISLLKEIL